MAVTASWDGRVTVWHMDGLRQRLVLHAPDTTNMMSAHCCVSPDDEYIAATFCTGDVHVWEAGTGELRYTVTTSLRVPFHPAFSATDFLVVPAGDGCLCIHDAATGAYTCTLRFPVRSPVTATAFSDDGVWLTAGTVAGNYFMHNLTIVTQRRDRQRSVLIVIACGRRRGRPRLPGELWDWIFAERLL
jgi:WD40 repeat protein